MLHGMSTKKRTDKDDEKKKSWDDFVKYIETLNKAGSIPKKQAKDNAECITTPSGKKIWYHQFRQWTEEIPIKK
jgi:predicted transcriptional regulator